MKTFSDELNKTAVATGKAIKLIEKLEKKIFNYDEILKNKDEFYMLAYTCRIGILDRIEKNGWSESQPIYVPFGLFRTKKTNIDSAIGMTVGRLFELAKNDSEVSEIVENILRRGNFFKEIDSTVPQSFKSQI